MTEQALQQTALHTLHTQAGARMVAFASYSMPVQYATGIIKEHLHTRQHAGLFDVSHMGQIRVRGEQIAARLEALMPADLVGLSDGQQRYALLTNDAGGIIDDLMVTRWHENEFTVVVNAAGKTADFAYLKAQLSDTLSLEMLTQHSLIALQGPATPAIMARLGCPVTDMKFMAARSLTMAGIPVMACRAGYSGEDGFEFSVADHQAAALCEHLLADDAVAWVGLGARDSLRLEAGLCLYGHDITTDTTPVAANLVWAIGKSRRADGPRAGGFPGADTILAELREGPARKLVGFRPEGRAPVREGAILEAMDGAPIGRVTSGGFSPSCGQPIGLGYIDTAHAHATNRVQAVVRDRRLPVTVVTVPFVPRNYYRGP